MKSLSRHESSMMAVSGAVAVLAFVAQVASCGGDDTAGPPADAGTDLSTGDAHVDGPVGVDAADAGADAASDSPLDSRGDTAMEAAIDAPSLGAFNLTLAQTFCTRLESCCLATSSTWDQAKCVSILSNPAYGGVEGIGFATVAFDGGHINYDPALANQCLQQVANVPCGLVASTALNSVQALCLSAIAGTIGAGVAGCKSSYECVPGTYCALVDGGPGTCLPLVGDGGACTSEDMCSYLSNPPPSLYCNTQAQNCQPRLDVDAGCTSNTQCATNVCQFHSTGSLCSDRGVVSDPGVPNGTCDFFSIHDAGGGG